MSTWPRERQHPFHPTSAPASRPWRKPTPPSRGPRAWGAKLRCLRNKLDVVASAGQTNHGRDQEQHHGDKEDGLGDLDGHPGDTAKAQNARDQRDDEKCNDPAQHDTASFSNSVSTSALIAPIVKTSRNRNKSSGHLGTRKRGKRPISTEQNRL